MARAGRARYERLHMSELAEGFHPAAFILCPSGAFSGRCGPQLRDDLWNRVGAGVHGPRAGHAAEAAIAGTGAAIEIQIRQGNPFLFEIFPNIQLGPVEQGMHTHMRTGGERGFVLVPEFRRLVAKIPFPMFVP